MPPKNLGIKAMDHLDFVVRDLPRSRGFYVDKMDFAEAGRSNAAYTEATGETCAVFDAAKVRIVCSAPARKDSDAGHYLANHPDGIRTVAFRVEDLGHAHKTLVQRGANLIEEPAVLGGRRQFRIATPLGDVEYAFIEGEPGLDARLSAVVRGQGRPGANGHGFTHVDHITSNTRDMRSLVRFYQEILGFEHFWDIRFHTRDANPDAAGSGLNSIVVRDAESNIKLATNEPLRPNFANSQIQKFVQDNGGPGVQHVAFGTGQILDAVPGMREAGLKFLETPDAYYEMLPRRMAERAVENLKEDLEDLRRNRILVDGRDNRYLLQIFMQEGALLYNEAAAGPFFYEVIQRKGEQGFGEGNFRALFESIERQQKGETQRTLQNPYIND